MIEPSDFKPGLAPVTNWSFLPGIKNPLTKNVQTKWRWLWFFVVSHNLFSILHPFWPIYNISPTVGLSWNRGFFPSNWAIPFGGPRPVTSLLTRSPPPPSHKGCRRRVMESNFTSCWLPSRFTTFERWIIAIGPMDKKFCGSTEDLQYTSSSKMYQRPYIGGFPAQRYRKWFGIPSANLM